MRENANLFAVFRGPFDFYLQASTFGAETPSSIFLYGGCKLLQTSMYTKKQEGKFPLLLSLFLVYDLELEEVLRVVVADILNHLIYAFHLAVRNLTVFHVAAHEVTQGTTEVLVTRIREE